MEIGGNLLYLLFHFCERPYLVDTDACKSLMGLVLVQKQLARSNRTIGY